MKRQFMEFLKYCLSLSFFLVVLQMNAQDVTISATHEEAAQFETVTIPITATGHQKIESTQFGVLWDTFQLEFVSVQDFNTTLGITDDNFGYPGKGAAPKHGLTYILDDISQPVSIPDGSVLFSITLKVLASPSVICDVKLGELPTKQGAKPEIIKEGKVAEVRYNHGSVSVSSTSGTGDLTYILANASVEKGEQICVPFKVENFTDIVTFNFGLFYDKDVFRYEKVQNFNLKDLAGNSFNLGYPGGLAVSWNITDGASVPDGTAIFEICFTAIGDEGQSSSLTLGDITYNGNTLEQEAVGKDGNVINTITKEGKLTIGSNSSGEFGLELAPDPINTSDKFSIPIVVNGNDELSSAQFTISWDKDYMTYGGLVDGSTLHEDLSLGESNVENGQLIVLWSSITGVPLEFNEGDIFFQLEFQLKGECLDGQKIRFTEDAIKYEFSDIQSDVPTKLIDGNLTCEPYSVQATVKHEGCSEECDGEISLDIKGWDVESIKWSNPNIEEDKPNVTGICAGTYSVTVTYKNGREVSKNNITVNPKDPITIKTDSIYAAISGGENGRAVLSATGGSGNYTFTTSPGNINGSKIENLAAGEYIVNVTDGECSEVDTFVVLNVEADITGVVCNGGTDGTANFNVTGGSGNYVFSYDCSTDTDANITMLPVGKCSAEVTDIDDGNVNFFQFTITEPTPIEIQAVIDSENGNVDIEVTGGDEPYTYEWLPTGMTTQDVTGLEPGVYNVFVTDANGCKVKSEDIVISDDMDIFETNSIAENNGFGVSCFGDCNGFIKITSTYTEPVSIEWEDGSNKLERVGLCPGTYSYTVKNSEGEVIAENSVKLEEPEELKITDINTKCVSDLEDDGEVEIFSEGGTGEHMFSLNGSGYDSVNTITDLLADKYTIYVRDENGCEKSKEFIITECTDNACYEGSYLMTPNGDGKNDYLLITCVENVDADLEIYTKWGKQVYKQKRYDNTWNGVNQEGEDLIENTYLWVLKIKDSNDNTSEIKKGAVEIIRSLN